MKKSCLKGTILIAAEELNLDLTLLGGQSFRWNRIDTTGGLTKWSGVAYNSFWEVTQTKEAIQYEVYPQPGISNSAEYFKKLLIKYFRLDFDLKNNTTKWKSAHDHFDKASTNFKAVRVLEQEPLENIISFICSQNNHIRRITIMIQWICSKYGFKIGTFNGLDQYTFPSLDILAENRSMLESEMRKAKFGYRAKFIAQSVEQIMNFGGTEWFSRLKDLPYEKARLELVKLPGIGFKVSDCICLMSLNHLEAVPVDTHIFKIAKSSYMPALERVKSVTPKIYEEIRAHLRSVYGVYAGWAQTVLFCADLQQFQAISATNNMESKPKSKKKKKEENVDTVT